MAALAAQADAGVLVSDLEMEADGPSYTSATLDRLAARRHRPRELLFITGADAFRDIDTWKDYPRLLDRCHFVVVSRPGVPGRLRRTLPALAGRMIETAVRPPPLRYGGQPSEYLVSRRADGAGVVHGRPAAHRQRARRSTGWCRTRSPSTSRDTACTRTLGRVMSQARSRMKTPPRRRPASVNRRVSASPRSSRSPSPPRSTRRPSTSSCSTCGRRRPSPTSS